jgi:hypothetical protein
MVLGFELYRTYPNDNQTEKKETIEESNTSSDGIKQEETALKSETNKAEQPKLNPQPNSELSKNDLNLIIKKKIKDKSISEIVEIIYKLNPSEIANIYSSQKPLYERELIFKNPSVFKDNKCISDSIGHIPTFKKQ